MIKFCHAQPIGYVVANRRLRGRAPEAAMLANGAYEEMMWGLRNPDTLLPAHQRHRMSDELRAQIRRLADDVAVDGVDLDMMIDHVPRVRAAYDRARVMLAALS